MREVVFLVVSPGFIHASYWDEVVATSHARCITGARTVELEVFMRLPPEIRVDIEVDEQGAAGADSENWDDVDTPLEPHD